MAASLMRYARALADVVISRKLDPAKTVQEIELLLSFVKSNPELETVWENPSIQAQQKLALLDAIVAKAEISPASRNFFAVLIDHGLIRALPEIVLQFKRELDKRLSVADAEITTFRQLSSDEKKSLEEKVAEATGKTVRARYTEDEKILGGAIVKIDSTIYDGSVLGQLERLKQQLSAG